MSDVVSYGKLGSRFIEKEKEIKEDMDSLEEIMKDLKKKRQRQEKISKQI